MVCRVLRSLNYCRWILTGFVCLSLVASASLPVRQSLGDDELVTIGLRAPEAPLAALAANSTVRFEKQAASSRLTFHKPERGAHASRATRVHVLPPRFGVSSPSARLPRRFLLSRHLSPRPPDDSGDPFLAASLHA
jgi:hypothetical protein